MVPRPFVSTAVPTATSMNGLLTPALTSTGGSFPSSAPDVDQPKRDDGATIVSNRE